MRINVPGISEVPSEARNLDEAIAKSDMLLLSECDSTEPTKLARVGRSSSIYFIIHN
ncbi:MAG: hypothetical protein N2V78_05870 [Methanophagales archaeon]|nr:hypothetical protein [Methanophagales archaeon]